MPIFNGSEIVLSESEADNFFRQALNPVVSTLRKRDAFLAEINNSLCIEDAAKGVNISFADEAPTSYAVVTAGQYRLQRVDKPLEKYRRAKKCSALHSRFLMHQRKVSVINTHAQIAAA